MTEEEIRRKEQRKIQSIVSVELTDLTKRIASVKQATRNLASFVDAHKELLKKESVDKMHVLVKELNMT